MTADPQHVFNPTILREYDVRGVVGETLFPVDGYHLGRALGTRILNEGGDSVCICYDGRLSSPQLATAVMDGLCESGILVLDIGIGPTPMLYFAVHHFEAGGGVMITGSHNPPQYNGFKLLAGTRSVFGEQIQELGKVAAKGDYRSGQGRVERRAIHNIYLARLLRDFDFNAPSFSIAWDPGNGSAGGIIRDLVGRLPGRHILLNAQIDGRFPAHHPDPTDPKNLVQLQNTVIKNRLDFGLAFDGDGDRIGAVDGRGRILWGDQILMILARDVLAEVPGAPIIADVKASQVLFDDIAAHGGEPVMWRTGHSLIKAKMLEINAPLAGEMSGHIFFSHRYYGFDDAIYAALRLIAAVGRQGGNLGALVDDFPAVVNTPELRFPCPDERKFQVVDEVRARLIEAGQEFNDIDGVRVKTPDGWWLLRASNTQDVLVARCEAQNEAGLERLKADLVGHLSASGMALPEA